MPLPVSDSPWPPMIWRPIGADIAEWDVWYSGDADRLAAFYAPASKDERRFRMPLWGRPRQDPTKPERKRIHVPLAAAIAAAAADLLFGEMPTFDAGAATDGLEGMLDEIDAPSTLIEGAELASGLGGVYLVPGWDLVASDRPTLRVVDADIGIPEFRSGVLTAVTFWTDIETDEDGKIWRHLERYEVVMSMAGVRECWRLHGLFCGTKENLGYQAPLTAKAATKALAGEDGTGAVNMTALLDIGRCIVGFVPNIKPNRMRRKHPLGRWMGRADTAGLESVMASLDGAWSSLDRDIDLSKARLLVDDQYLKRAGRGSGAWFDSDQEIISPLLPSVSAADSGNVGIELVQPDIRTEQLMNAAQAAFDLTVSSSGYSTQSLGQDGDGGLKTATQVDAEVGLSAHTTSKKRGYWESALADVCEVLLAIDRVIFKSQVAQVRPKVEWPEVDESPEVLAARVNLWSVSGSASTETRVRELHEDWDDPKVAEEVERLKAESSAMVPDPTGFGG